MRTLRVALLFVAQHLLGNAAAGYTGPAYTPPPPATPGIVALASLFDRVVILCYMDACKGQQEAWPNASLAKLVLIDTQKVNERLGIDDVNDHGYKVTAGHAEAWALLKEPDIHNILILEDDWRPVKSHADDMYTNATNLAAVKAFVDSGDWSLARVGYRGPENVNGESWYHFHASECASTSCSCESTPQTDLICAITLPSEIEKAGCDMRSTVGYALHESMFGSLHGFAHASFYNTTLRLGESKWAVGGRRFIGKMDAKARGYFETPIDMWFSSAVRTVHYFTPGLLFQNGMTSEDSMRKFKKHCVTTSTDKASVIPNDWTPTAGSESRKPSQQRGLQAP